MTISRYILGDADTGYYEPLDAERYEDAVEEACDRLRDWHTIDWDNAPLGERVTRSAMLLCSYDGPHWCDLWALDQWGALHQLDGEDLEPGDVLYAWVQDVTVEFDQPEPPCPESGDGEHDWRRPYILVGGVPPSPGVRGHGGGVQITSACVLCGCGRHEDTWALDPTTGREGHYTTRYIEGEFAERLSRLTEAERVLVQGSR